MRLIDADALKKCVPKTELDIFENCRTCRLLDDYQVVEIIDESPTIDAEPVRHGHWVICSDGYYPYCSKCKQEPDGKNMTNYCPNCGADMRGGDNT